MSQDEKYYYGFVNVGTSGITTNYHGKPLESGILMSSEGNIDVIKTTLLQ